ncbi:MAG TPA: hypothetical protein VGG39_27930 [Polyangiaceae bacterium]
MNHRFPFAAIACVLIGAAVFALVGGVGRARTRPPSDPSLLVAGRGAVNASPLASAPGQVGDVGGDVDEDECTRSAGFWAPADDSSPGEGAPRRMECKRYA